jgi:uncharacterized protein YyaL (SSP411 family)
MISALAQAAATFDDDAMLTMACQAADALRVRLRTADGRILRRLRGDTAGIPGFLDDY